jgi:NAD(P)-dependent dehydrogenase (short-subunit alcohol dehydrogenase family)
MAIKLESTAIKANACSPGFVKTNLNGHVNNAEGKLRELEPWRRPHASRGAWRCSARVVRRVRSRAGKTQPSRGDQATKLLSIGKQFRDIVPMCYACRAKEWTGAESPAGRSAG